MSDWLLAERFDARLFASRKSADLAGEHSVAAVAAFGSQAGAAFGFARLLVKLSASHLFLDAAAFYQFSESPNCLLNRLPITYE